MIYSAYSAYRAYSTYSTFSAGGPRYTIESKLDSLQESLFTSFIGALDENTAALWEVQVYLPQEPEAFNC